MATLGDTGTPDTAVAYYRPRTKAVYVGQMSENGTLQSASVYCDSSIALNQDFSLGVFTGSASFPITYVGAAEVVATPTAGWVTATLSGSLNSGDHIWVAFCVDPVDGSPVNNENTFRLYGTAAGSTANVRQGANETGVYPAMTTPWTNDATFTQNQPAAYITYSTSGASGNPYYYFAQQ